MRYQGSSLGLSYVIAALIAVSILQYCNSGVILYIFKIYLWSYDLIISVKHGALKFCEKMQPPIYVKDRESHDHKCIVLYAENLVGYFFYGSTHF